MKVDKRRAAVSAQAQELAKQLGVSIDDPDKMSLLHSLAVLQVGDSDMANDMRNQ